MNDLPDLLDDASQPEGDWLADPHALLAEGRHRVRRRRLQLAAGAAAAVLLGATASAVVAPRLTAGPEPATPDDKPGNVYVEQRIPLDEVERRCQLYMDSHYGHDEKDPYDARPWVTGVDGDGRAVSGKESVRRVEDRVAQYVEMAREGDPLDLDDEEGKSCLISQPGVMGDLEVNYATALTSDRAFLTACSGIIGYDVSGWPRVATAKDEQQWQAVFVSANGYAAQCAIDRQWGDTDTLLHEDRFYDDSGRPIVQANEMPPVEDINRYLALHPQCDYQDTTWTRCRGLGMLSSTDPEVTIEVTLPDGTVEQVQAIRGGFAYSFRIRTSELPPKRGVEVTDPIFPTRILDADGRLIWEGWQDQDK